MKRDAAIAGITVLLCVLGFLIYGRALPSGSRLPPQSPIPSPPGADIPSRDEDFTSNRLVAPVFLSRQFVESLDVPEPPRNLVAELLNALMPGKRLTPTGLAAFVERCREPLDANPDMIGVLVTYWGDEWSETALHASKEIPDEYLVRVGYGMPWLRPWAVRRPTRIGFEDAETNGPN